MEHTSGPWVIDPECQQDIVPASNPENIGIAIVQPMDHNGNQWIFGQQSEANARLIAAAPELLEALELAAETFRRYEGHHRAKQTPDAFDKALANQALAVRLEAVIAKAKGLKPDQVEEM